MAISIDTVYQRVLAIANKEQRGYLTPQEFNLFANQSQMEIFEQYFYDISQFGRVHGNDTEYSDMLDIINEKISIFRKNQVGSANSSGEPAYLATFGSSLVTNGTFSDDIASWTAGTAAADNGGSQAYDSGAQSIKLKNDATNNTFKSTQSITTTAGALYRVKVDINANSLNTTGSNSTATARVTFNGFPSVSVTPGSTVTVEFFVTATAANTNLKLVITGNGNTGATDFALFDNIEVKEVSGRKLTLNSDIYRLGSVLYTNSNGNFLEVDKILPNELIYINSSPLTKPTASNPAYVLERYNSVGNNAASYYSISVYPSSVVGTEISYNYIAKPRKCNWGYSIVNEQALYDAGSSVDFELHESETVTIVNKILELAGISMQKPDIVQVAAAKDNKEIKQEKS